MDYHEFIEYLFNNKLISKPQFERLNAKLDYDYLEIFLPRDWLKLQLLYKVIFGGTPPSVLNNDGVRAKIIMRIRAKTNESINKKTNKSIDKKTNECTKPKNRLQTGGQMDFNIIKENYDFFLLSKESSIIQNKLILEKDIEVPAEIALYEKLDITLKDNYRVKLSKDFAPTIFLINGDNKLCGIFSLIKDEKLEDTFYLTCDAKNMKCDVHTNNIYSFHCFKTSDKILNKTLCSLLKMTEESKDMPVFSKTFQNNIFFTKVNISINSLKQTDSILCIDFGTSNTTAGCYLDDQYIEGMSKSHPSVLNKTVKLNDINFVNYLGESKKEIEWTSLLPTLIYVDKCANKDNIKYLFGHGANARIRDENYCPKGKVFLRIKEWMTSFNTKEEIYDSEGAVLKEGVDRKSIIKAYLDYVINIAENQFKCKFNRLHISTPVKQKNQYLMAFQTLFPEYNLEVKFSLDEGIAVLYNTINQKLKNKQESGTDDKEEYKCLVIDCGGGTTDLASCDFSINIGEVAYELNISTAFENGYTDFGGDNLTFRIMQYMKILYAYYYLNDGKELGIDNFIDSEVDTFRKVDDDNGVEKIYEKFEKHYKEAEKIIPTLYQDYKNESKKKYELIRNNFYFMWAIAEEMKKQFFLKSAIQRNKFASDLADGTDADLNITQLKQWSLSYINKKGEIIKVPNGKFPSIVFTLREINLLIRADIYNIIRKLLDELYESNELNSYNIIKLSGQSCKIEIFKEALKEFVAGKAIKSKKAGKVDNNSLELKLACLRGCIQYFRDKQTGIIDVTLGNDPSLLPYNIVAKDFRGKEQVLITKKTKINEIFGQISKIATIDLFEVFLKNDEQNIIKEYKFINNKNDYKKKEVVEILSSLKGKAKQEDLDSIKKNNIKFFVYNAGEEWGIFITPVKRQDDNLYIGKTDFFSFEEDSTQALFFEGGK